MPSWATLAITKLFYLKISKEQYVWLWAIPMFNVFLSHLDRSGWVRCTMYKMEKLGFVGGT